MSKHSELTQHEIDLLIGKSWPEIVAVRQQLEKIDDRRDQLGHINDEYEAGQPVGIFLFDQTGNIYFKHRVSGPCAFFDRVLTECAGQLMSERAAVFTQSDYITSKTESQQAISIPTVAPETEWLTGQQVIERAGIVPAYLSVWIKNNGFDKKRIGKGKLYGAPAGFVFKPSRLRK